MGKGKRNRQTDERQIKKQAVIASTENNKKRIKATITISVCVAIVIVASIFGGVFLKKISDDGYFLRSTICAQTNDFKVNNAMMCYFFRTEYSKFVNANSDSLSSFNLDTSIPLKDQIIPDSENTWFEYFSQTSMSLVKEYLILAQNANKMDISLESHDIKIIDESLDYLRKSAEQEKIDYNTYMDITYGKGVREKDIRAALELRTLAIKYYNFIKESYSYDDDKINQYFNKNPESFLKCDYKSYEFLSSDPAKDEQNKNYAQQLAACKTSEEFDAYITQYLKNTSEKSNTDIKTEVEKTLVKEYAYNVSDDFGKWAFDKQRKANDTKITEENGKYTVYFLVTPSYYDDYITKNVRHIMFTADVYGSDEKAKAKAEEVFEKWNNSEKTDDVFISLVEEFSEDTNTSNKDGIIKNALKGDITGSFESWVFNAERKPGDCKVLKSDYGYHIAYFIGDGIPAFKQIATDKLKEIDYNKKYEDLQTKTTIKINQDVLSKIPDIA